MESKERPYGFVTTTGFLLEAKGSNAKQAYGKALKHHKRIDSTLKGALTKHYQTYGKSGFAPAGMFRTLGVKYKR